MNPFKGKTVFVTGAAGGLGKALCRELGISGARVAALDLDRDGVGALARELCEQGVDCRAYGLDVTDEAACRSAIDQVAGDFGGLDVLIANAGITHRSAFEETQTKVFRQVMEVNFFGSLYCAQAALPHLKKSRGQMVVVSSIAGFTPLLGRTGYSASKHALHGLFDSLRSEVKKDGVSITIVCPGFTATNINTAALDFDGRPSRHPQSTVGKVATAKETAQNILQATAQKKRLAVFSSVGRLSRLVSRISPGLYEKLMARSVAKELERD